MISNSILKGDIYMILYSLYCDLLDDKIDKMRLVQENEYALNNLLDIKTLNLNYHFAMDPQIK